MIAAIEAGLWESRLATAASAATEIHDGSDMLRFSTGIPFAPFNGVLRTRLTKREVDSAIDSTLLYFQSRNLPMSWMVEPSAEPDDLADRLTAKGFVRESDGETGMAVDLESLGTEPEGPSGLKIERVPSNGWRDEFAAVMAAGFGIPGPFLLDFIGILADASDRHPGSQTAYLGRLDGQPVATSMLLLSGGVAGIYNVATAEQTRGKGIGTAMTYAPLLEAHRRGYRIAILQSSEMGLRVYERLGFREYCRFSEFVWESAEAQPPNDFV